MIYSPSLLIFFALLLVFLLINKSSQASVSAANKKTVRLINLASLLVPYNDAWKYQKKLLHHHIENQSQDETCVGTLIILQHKPVFTFGTATEDQNTGSLKATTSSTNTSSTNTFQSQPTDTTKFDDDGLEYDVVTVERAGQGTFHGPGQLVLYPILDLNYFEKDINLYLRRLEEIVIRTCADHSVTACRVDGLTGVWAGEKADSKIAAIGIKLRRWVTMHGVSINVNPDLRYFSKIVPCGISDRSVGSLTQFATDASLSTVSTSLLRQFESQFDITLTPEITNEAGLQYLEGLPFPVGYE